MFNPRFQLCYFLLLASLGFTHQALAADGESKYQIYKKELREIRVYGREIIDPKDATEPTKIGKQQLDKQKHADVTRVLKQVPGVQIRDEDAFGLRPNIGIRGTNPDRSKKIVLLEDGVLIAPAPYSAPAAYFTPSMATTDGLEVFKGFAAIPYGPNSVGGAINYKTQNFSSSDTLSAELALGQFASRRIKLTGTQNFEKLQLAYTLHHAQTNGFKELDNGGNTGFKKSDALLKAKYKINSKNSFSFKYGFSTEDSNESYLGLSLDDFNSTPNRRYAASQLDVMEWQHHRAQVNHNLQINDSSYLKTSAYFNSFNRVWDRFDRFADGTRPNELLLGQSDNTFLFDILTGQANSSGSADQLILANNNRRFNSYGLQTQYGWLTENNDLQVFAKLHTDNARIDHTFNNYSMRSGSLFRSNGATGRDELNEGSARALSVGFKNVFSLKRWSLTAQTRIEDVSFSRDNLLTSSTTKKNSDSFIVPGFGASYSLTEAFAIKASVNQAINVAGVNFVGDAKNEEAINYEFGFRYQSKVLPAYTEVTFFYNDYKNIAGVCSVSSGGCNNASLGTQFDGGAAKIYGSESLLGYQFQYKNIRFPVQASLSLTQAKFANSFTSSSPEWGLGSITNGSRLPYVPKIQYTLNLGAQYKKFSSFLSMNYQSDMVDQSVEENQIIIPAFGIADLNISYAFKNGVQSYLKVDNVFGKSYAVAARPFGLRPGKPFTFQTGISYQF